MSRDSGETLAAERPVSLDGLVLGVLDNNKHGSKVFLEKVVELLRARFNLRDVVWASKLEPTWPADSKLLEGFIPRADVFITAIGD